MAIWCSRRQRFATFFRDTHFKLIFADVDTFLYRNLFCKNPFGYRFDCQFEYSHTVACAHAHKIKHGLFFVCRLFSIDMTIRLEKRYEHSCDFHCPDYVWQNGENEWKMRFHYFLVAISVSVCVHVSPLTSIAMKRIVISLVDVTSHKFFSVARVCLCVCVCERFSLTLGGGVRVPCHKNDRKWRRANGTRMKRERE